VRNERGVTVALALPGRRNLLAGRGHCSHPSPPTQANDRTLARVHIARIQIVWYHTIMSLKQEIELNRDFVSRNEELVLALIRTSQVLEQESAAFLSQYQLSPTQFNALMIVRDYEADGIKQSELARRLLINRASTGALIDGLERRELLCRRLVPGDRRAYHLTLSRRATNLLKRLLGPYYERIDAVFSSLSGRDMSSTLRVLDKVRAALRTELETLAHAK